jgi:hypothetical protein
MSCQEAFLPDVRIHPERRIPSAQPLSAGSGAPRRLFVDEFGIAEKLTGGAALLSQRRRRAEDQNVLYASRQ